MEPRASVRPPRRHPAGKLWGRPTLKDVAGLAGVARSTVSAILADKPHCYASAQTRQRVWAAARQLNYQPNALSRALLGQQTGTIGLILRTLDPGGDQPVRVDSLERLATDRGCRLLVGAHAGDAARQLSLLNAFLSQRVDGLIVQPVHDPEGLAFLGRLVDEDVPVVALDPPPTLPATQVSVARQHAGYLQARHLLERGRRRILFLVEASDPWAKVRTTGHRLALKELHADPKQHVWLNLEGSPTDAALADALTRIDAVAAGSDMLALRVMRDLARAGRRVPDDVAIIGCGDEPFAQSLPIALSSIAPPRDLDRLAFDLLMEQVNRPADAPGRHHRLARTPTLVVRESTG